MGTFTSRAVIRGGRPYIEQMAHDIEDDFQYDGYDVASQPTTTGGYDISITKGGTFKAVLGMKTALKVTLLPMGDDVSFEAGVGIWGQQAIPTVISMLFFWPVLITQIWGMISQSKLDDRALRTARMSVAAHGGGSADTQAAGGTQAADGGKYCTHCGAKNAPTAKFCSECGQPL